MTRKKGPNVTNVDYRPTEQEIDKINSDLFVKILEVIIFIISKAFILDGPRKTESINININNKIKNIMLIKFLVVLI